MNKERMSMEMDNNFIEEFGGEENIDALNVLIGAVTDGEGEELQGEELPPEELHIPEEALPPEEAVVPQEVIDPSIPPPPQVNPDTQAILSQMQEQNNNIAAMQEQMRAQPQQAPQPEPELTEEEEAIVELKKRIGFDKLEEQNMLMKQQLEEQTNRISKQDTAAHELAVRSDIDSLKIEFNGFDERLVAQELEAMSQQPVMLPSGQIASDERGNPVNHAMLNDNKEGWARIWNEKFAQTTAPKPDPIVPAGAGNTAPSKSPIDRIKESNDNVSTGEALLDLIGR